MATSITIDRGALREAIRHEYGEVASQPTKGFHFHTGHPLAERLGYPLAEVDRLPPTAVESFAGVGNPFALGSLNPGEAVVDVGSGSGLDALLAGRQVGPGGRVVGVDMTPAMLEKARASAETLGLTHVEFREGLAEALPVADASVDVVISNGVINLSPDKEAVYREINRVLKPGGRVQIADIVVRQAVSTEAKEDISLWTGWIAGALLEAELTSLVEGAGFTDVRLGGERYDVFSDAPSESSAAAFGTEGVALGARKPAAR